ncbi:complex I subunit 5 family protein [Haloarchaeobius sp. HRN-SO-5]|uniref:complex I subunit 5 family protein n=1 Tax=Haloarchaeobius sp. HRN-SO-5 TaxID=3446118 RepID=UPI003EB88D88
MTTPSVLPLAIVVVPLAAVVPILASGARPTVREGWTFVAALLTLGVTSLATTRVLNGVVSETVLGELVQGTPFAFRVDALGALFALLASFLWLVASVYSVGYMRSLDEHDQTRYFAAFAASIGTTMGVALAANLLTLFVFYELLTVATYPLVTHHETAEARRSGRKYLAYTLTGGVAILAGIVLVYVTAGSVDFVAGGLSGLESEPVVATVAYALLVAGFGVKAAVMPLHGWLPDAMVAPTPVSGLLHAVAVVKSGVFGLARVVLFVFGVGTVRSLGLGDPLAFAAAATMLLGGVLALRQDKLKRGLAYSTVSQLSYIVLGVALLTPTAVFGALLHLVAHAFMKITLFFCAGAIYVETDVEYVGEMGGIWRRLPATMTAFAVGSAGLVGFPGIAGFVSKWHLVLGALEADALPYAAVFLLAGVLKLLFLWPVLLTAYSGGDALTGFRPVRDHDDGARNDEPAAAHDGGREAPDEDEQSTGWDRRTPLTESTWRLVGPILVTAGGAIVLGVVPDATPFWDLARTVSTGVVP